MGMLIRLIAAAAAPISPTSAYRWCSLDAIRDLGAGDIEHSSLE